METIKLKNGQILRILQDDQPLNPREDFDNLGVMVCHHKRYNLGDEHNIDYNNYESFEDMVDQTIENGVYLPLYLYDHGNLSISYKPFSCPWDSGLVGFIYVTAQKIRAEYGNTNAESRTSALNVLKSEVERYNDYLSGNVYGYELIEIEKCSLGHNHEGIVDSCWGFFGDDHKKSGLFDQLGIDLTLNIA